MKIRNGFVSNSSSSSFIILLSVLNDLQKEMIYDHIYLGKEIDNELKEKGNQTRYVYYDEWFIEEDELSLWAHTSMDNFDLEGFLIEEVGITKKDIIYMGDGWDKKKLFDTEEYYDFKMKIRSEKLNKLKNNINETRG